MASGKRIDTSSHMSARLKEIPVKRIDTSSHMSARLKETLVTKK